MTHSPRQRLLALSLSCLLQSALSFPSSAATSIVRTDGTGDYTTIVAAVTAAAPGDRILVGPGTYNEVVQILFPIELVAEDPTQPPVLTGMSATRPLRIATGNQSLLTRIEDLVLQDGFSTDTGGAIFVTSNSGVSISNCRFYNNRTNFGAGAIHARFNSVVEIDNCHFEENYARVGGGAATVILGARLNFTDCTFLRNSTDELGGAIATDEAILTIVRCAFLANSSLLSTGVINLNGSDATIGESTFSLNTSHSRGTIRAEFGSSLTLANCILSGDALGYAISLTSSSIVKATCNIFWENGLGDFSVPPAVSQNNMVLDPLFCDPGALPLTVQSDSPAVLGIEGCTEQIGAYGAACSGPSSQLAASVAVVTISEDRTEVTLAVQLAALVQPSPAVAGMDLQLNWDSSLLDLTGVQAVGEFDGFSVAFNETVGQVLISMASAAGILISESATPLLELHFDALQPFDAAEVLLQIQHCFAEDLSEISVESTNLLLFLQCGDGDLDGDTVVNSADAIFLLQVLAGLREDSTSITCSGDLNHTGALDIGDVVLVLQRAVGNSSEKLDTGSEASIVVGPAAEGIQLVISNAAGMDLQLPANATVGDVTVSIGLQITSATGDRILWATAEISESSIHMELQGITVEQLSASQISLVDESGLPVTFSLAQDPVVDTPSADHVQVSIFPNPFNAMTRVQVVLPDQGHVLARIFDGAGRVVWSASHAAAGPGNFAFTWSGTDLHRVPVASGAYYLVVEALGTATHRKLALVK